MLYLFSTQSHDLNSNTCMCISTPSFTDHGTKQELAFLLTYMRCKTSFIEKKSIVLHASIAFFIYGAWVLFIPPVLFTWKPYQAERDRERAHSKSPPPWTPKVMEILLTSLLSDIEQGFVPIKTPHLEHKECYIWPMGKVYRGSIDIFSLIYCSPCAPIEGFQWSTIQVSGSIG